MRTSIVAFFIGIGLFILSWSVASHLIDSKFILPRPGLVGIELWKNQSHYLQVSSRTFLIAASGLLLSTVVAIIIGILTSIWKHFEVIYPVLVTIKATPAVVFAPIFACLIGSGWIVKISVAFLITLFPVVISTIEGIRLTPNSLRNLGVAYGASRFRSLRYIEIYYLINGLLGGLQSAAPLAVIGAIVAEFVDPAKIGDGGIGIDIARNKNYGQVELLFAGSICAVVIGVSTFWFTFILTRAIQRKYDLAE